MFMKIWARCLGELRATQAEAAGTDIDEYRNSGAMKDSVDAMSVLQAWEELAGDITIEQLKKIAPGQDNVFWNSFKLAYVIVADLDPFLKPAGE